MGNRPFNPNGIASYSEGLADEKTFSRFVFICVLDYQDSRIVAILRCKMQSLRDKLQQNLSTLDQDSTLVPLAYRLLPTASCLLPIA